MSPIHLNIPHSFDGIGYTRDKNSLPLEIIPTTVPFPGDGEVLIHAYSSSLNALEYKLALLNFFGRNPPVILGFDLSGVVVAVGSGVNNVVVGDEVMAMADSNKDGAWAIGGTGGYALARSYLTVKKTDDLTFDEAAALPICFLAAYMGVYSHIKKGDTVFIPGGAGGVGHLAIQMAANALGAKKVISSGGSPQSLALAASHGANEVFNYRTANTSDTIMALTDGEGADLVFDATYNEASFVETAKSVKTGGKWVVLGVGPGKTARSAETESPVKAILASRHAHYFNANILNHFTDTSFQTPEIKAALSLGLDLAIKWYREGKVRPWIGKRIEGTLTDVNRELLNIKEGRGAPGKTVVTLKR
jgi:NADPH:quinone reductase-like Zn-dependent oxidoreductase